MQQFGGSFNFSGDSDPTLKFLSTSRTPCIDPSFDRQSECFFSPVFKNQASCSVGFRFAVGTHHCHLYHVPRSPMLYPNQGERNPVMIMHTESKRVFAKKSTLLSPSRQCDILTRLAQCMQRQHRSLTPVRLQLDRIIRRNALVRKP